MVGVQTHFRVKPNSVEVVLRLSWGCDNLNSQGGQDVRFRDLKKYFKLLVLLEYFTYYL